MSVPPFVLEILVICMYAAALVGLNPARNWLVLLIPLPNGSAFGPLNAGLSNSPDVKYWVCHVANGSVGGGALVLTQQATSWTESESMYHPVPVPAFAPPTLPWTVRLSM